MGSDERLYEVPALAARALLLHDSTTRGAAGPGAWLRLDKREIFMHMTQNDENKYGTLGSSGHTGEQTYEER